MRMMFNERLPSNLAGILFRFYFMPIFLAYDTEILALKSNRIFLLIL
jgi:hypothetical protein